MNQTRKTPLPKSTRQAFLLRIWFEPNAQGWRFFLKSAETGEQWLFTNHETFIKYIETHFDPKQIEVRTA